MGWPACNNCGGRIELGGWWCNDCRESLTNPDKWYLIGFLGLLGLRTNPNGMADESDDGMAFTMGRQDREGWE